MERRDVQGHYEQLAAEYDEHWAYGPHYITWMSARIAESLRLSSADRIADIGCGTGMFAREVARIVNPEHALLCVDPSVAMLRQIGTPPPVDLTPIVASAEGIAVGHVQLPYGQLDAIWLKESVHHVTDPAATLRGLANRLAPGGHLLVVMLPTSIEYPLFQAALDRFAELQPDPELIVDHLRAAGLRPQLRYVDYQLRLDREKYIGMVRARYMSVLSMFSDSEIKKGIEEMRAAHPEPVLAFPDRFAFVLGVKPGEGR
ncbi:class I SAM-dependent methyltransferase [Streptomyces noursei]|uniref:class I SAM-dependent methyltransferase n=1 Tax=Streptomyces noursei TaxID=1971 RepID=UPI00081CC4B3|nr:type 11 methyltransferase [Streptomyces noursei ATCC 11455]MCZ0992281.1 class I SAM-dependent methyltransferase [Streptomyces noursei]